MRSYLSVTTLVLAMLLFGTIVGFWVRSYHRLDYVHCWYRNSGSPPQVTICCLLSQKGLVSFAMLTGRETGVRPDFWDTQPRWAYQQAPANQLILATPASERMEDPDLPKGSIFNQLGFYYDPDGIVTVPHWFILLLSSWAPWLALRRIVRGMRRKHHPGSCIHCGYDLRASKDRCPECGNAFNTPSQ